MILGMPWLQRYNPMINWKEGTIDIEGITMERWMNKSHPTSSEVPTCEKEKLRRYSTSPG